MEDSKREKVIFFNCMALCSKEVVRIILHREYEAPAPVGADTIFASEGMTKSVFQDVEKQEDVN